jgi:prevent-host-death family protein
MAVQINIYEAKTKFSKLINKAIVGEEIIIAKSGKPVARLVPFHKPLLDRMPGSAKGKIVMADDFDEPLPEDILEAFRG